MPQKYSQKYTIICFFNAQDSTISFPSSDWPLHVTILDTFKTDWSLDKLTSTLEKLVSTLTSFDVMPAKQALLGPEKDVPVKLLRLDDGIKTLHNKLLELSNDGSFVYNTPEFVGPGFLPHVTDQKDNNAKIGQKHHLDSISLIDMFPNGDHMRRAIIDTFTLKD